MASACSPNGFEQRAAQGFIADLLKSRDQFHRLAIEDGQGRGVVIFLYGHSMRRIDQVIDAFIEISDRNAEHLCHFKKTPGRNSVHAFFVFLNLLKRKTEAFAQLFLGQFKFSTPPT